MACPLHCETAELGLQLDATMAEQFQPLNTFVSEMGIQIPPQSLPQKCQAANQMKVPLICSWTTHNSKVWYYAYTQQGTQIKIVQHP